MLPYGVDYPDYVYGVFFGAGDVLDSLAADALGFGGNVHHWSFGHAGQRGGQEGGSSASCGK